MIVAPAATPFGFHLAPHRRVFAAFLVYSFGLGGFFPRLAELQQSMSLTEGQLGLGLIGAAFGTLISLTFGGPLVERAGHRRTLLLLIPLLPCWYALAAHAAGPLEVFLCLVPAGVCIGAIEIVVNLEADRVEHLGGRRIMNRAHAFWSFGFFGAGAVGALAARAGLSPQLHLALVPLASLAGSLLLLWRFEPAPARAGGDGTKVPLLSRPTGAILLLVVVTLSAVLLEGAGFDWSAIYMRDVFQSAPFVGGIAVATGACAQAITRYFIDPVVERHTPVGVARALLALLGLGCLGVTFAQGPTMALAGFALMGVGTSALFPLAMSAAAQRTDRPAAVNVAALAQLSFVTFLLGPPLLGFVAEHLGIRWAFGVGLPLVVLSLLASGALARRSPL
jgi:MFS family permease